MSENNELTPFRCSFCGRFLGFQRLVEGEVYIFCSKCKGWSILAEGSVAGGLTGQQIHDRLQARVRRPKSPQRAGGQ